MKIMGVGIDHATGRLLVDPVDEDAFASALLDTMPRRASELTDLTQASATASTFRTDQVRGRLPDLADPREAGWTYLVNANDPSRKQIEEAIQPLAEFRNMQDPRRPLTYGGEGVDDWFDWLLENHSTLPTGKVPHYILIVGEPDQVPFHFQSFLGAAAAVGRVAFDSVSALKTYVDKVIRIEEATEPSTGRDVTFFATDGALPDPTYFSRRHLAEPLAARVEKTGLNVRRLIGEQATKANLLKDLSATKAAFVYTASHGMGAPTESLAVQRRVNGAICCQKSAGMEMKDWLLTAADVPSEPFLEGSIIFQFACFGYGTPAESDYMHWFGQKELNGTKDFIAALPRALLQHPRGPVAYVGHVDLAWLHGFDDPHDAILTQRLNKRLEPFASAVDTLLLQLPVGLAMSGMGQRYDISNAVLTSFMDSQRRGTLKVTEAFKQKLADTFITRSDAQNYLVFGDPAVHLRIPAAVGPDDRG